ncbi:MAG: Membrane protein involved in the export of O-antigen and teichoic acid [Chitinophagaceae bacterium]|nr:Membrane protein involved in the export of O-antigen and teichoic acid [Chitinophagaceae bacterium]
MGIVIRQSIKGTFWNYLGVVLGAANIMWVFPYFLTPKEIGIYRVVIDLGTLFAIFAGLGTGHIADRFYVKIKDTHRQGFIGYVCLMALAGFLLFSLAYWVFDDFFFDLFSKNASIIQSYKGYVLALTFAFVLLSLYDSIYRVRLNIVTTVFFREVFLRLVVLTTAVAVGLHWLYFDGLMNWVMASYFFTVLVLGIWYYLKYVKATTYRVYWPDKSTFRQINSFAFVILVGGGSAVLISRIDVLMITALMPNGIDMEVAVYSLGFFIASIIEIPRRSISQIATPLIANAWHHNDIAYIDDIYKRSAINQLIVGGGIFLLIWISIDDLLAIIPNSEVYANCKSVVLWVGIARMISMITGLNGEIILQSKYYLFNIVSVMVLVLLIVLFNYIFIPILGIEGAAIGTCLALFGYNLLKTFFLYMKLDMMPFSWHIVTVLVVGVLVYIPFAFWPSAGGGWWLALVNISLKSLVCIVLITPVLYKLGVSEEMNKLIDKALGIFLRRLG